MKKLFIILILALVTFSANAQKQKLTYDVSTLVAADTIFYFDGYTKWAWVFQWEYSQLDADDAVLDWGQSMNDSTCIFFISDSLPDILNKNHRVDNNVYGFLGMGSTRICAKFTKNSVTSGNLYFEGRTTP